MSDDTFDTTRVFTPDAGETFTSDGIWNEESDWEGLDFDTEGDEDAAIAVPTLAVVGRPNVGKSTLVNRIIGRREAVVEDVPGVTRDRVSYEANWSGRRFMVQDTGGWEPDAKGMQQSIARQAEMAMQTADAILLVVDAVVGATATDEAVARVLRRSKTPVILVANKVDDERTESEAALLWSLGLGEPRAVSATHGRGTGDLLDDVLAVLPETPREGTGVAGPRRVALVGKPNVGKSSLLNKLTGDERSVVHDVAGTTVDPVDSLVELGGKVWRFVDTAGLRKRVSHASGAEFYASLRTKGAIDAAEVAILLLDASEVISEQDLRVLSMVADAGRALVIAFNKWDLVDDDRRGQLEKEIDRDLMRVPWAQRVNVSAKTGRAVQKLVPALETSLASWDKRISTGQLNSWLKEVIAATPPPMRGGRLPRVMFATQAGTRPPTFVLFTTGFLEAGYRRFLERRLREEFNFDGSPVRISVRIREKRDRKK
ncbi:MAG: ribosome biogenesis GTPase Der [Rhodococcus sp. (in: high G+C Gram-positive bacteria)]